MRLRKSQQRIPPLALYFLLVLLCWGVLAWLPVQAAPAGKQDSGVGDGSDAELAPPTPYYQSGEKGWFWYEQPPVKPKKPQPKPVEATPAQAAASPHAPAKLTEDPNDPLVQLKQVQEAIERAQARAVLNPTPANVQAFMVVNAQAQAQAARFAETWQQVLWQTPQLDYRTVKPADDQAIHAYNDAKLAINEQFLREASQQYGLFFFFRSTCPYCHKLAPILKQFAETYGFHIVPVSLDGKGLPEFPEFQTSQQIALELKVEAVPAIFLVEPKKRDIQPISYGFITWDELRTRIYTVLNKHSANPQQAQQDANERYLQAQPNPIRQSQPMLTPEVTP